MTDNKETKKELKENDLKTSTGGGGSTLPIDPVKGTYGMVLIICKNCKYHTYVENPDDFGSCPDCGHNDWMRIVA